MEVIPLTNSKFAAEIQGFDASRFNEDEFQQLYATWLSYGVIRLRNQSMDDEQLMRFSQEFGPLEYSPMGKVTESERAQVPNPHVLTISNIRKNGKPIGGLGAGETSWHTDMSYVENPPKASLLYAVKVPPSGGDTHYCCMELALKELPLELRERLETIEVKHDAAHDSIGKLRRGFDQADTPIAAPGVYHPAILEHPETSENVLFLGRRDEAYIKGLSLLESEELLDEICQYVAKPSHVWTQEWQVGDLLIWDNRRLMHKRSSFNDSDQRLMRRTQVQGEIAVALA